MLFDFDFDFDFDGRGDGENNDVDFLEISEIVVTLDVFVFATGPIKWYEVHRYTKLPVLTCWVPKQSNGHGVCRDTSAEIRSYPRWRSCIVNRITCNIGGHGAMEMFCHGNALSHECYSQLRPKQFPIPINKFFWQEVYCVVCCTILETGKCAVPAPMSLKTRCIRKV